MRSRKKTLRRSALFVVTVGCVVGLMAGTALAAVTTIGALKAAPVADQEVTLTGTITQVVEGNEYVLDDGTGTITIDCGPAWYAGIGLATGATVTVTGEVDLGKPGGTATDPRGRRPDDRQRRHDHHGSPGRRPAALGRWTAQERSVTPGRGVPDDDDEVAGQPDKD